MPRQYSTYRATPETDPERLRALKREAFDIACTDDPKVISRTNLLRRPGWSEDMVAQLLGAEDFTTQNMRNKKLTNRYFLLTRVHKAETYKIFQRNLNNTATRRRAAKKAVATKRAHTQALLDERIQAIALKPNYTGLTKTRLRKKAVHHYNMVHSYWAEVDGRDFEPIRYRDCDTVFLNRITVNMLRHAGTTYDEELDIYIGKVGKAEAVEHVRVHIYDLIAAEYPHLAKECALQRERKGLPVDAVHTA